MVTYLYGLSDPRSPAEIRYVGVTGDLTARLSKHKTRPNSKAMRGWLGELNKLNLPLSVSVLGQFETLQDALHAEAERIEIGGPALFNKPQLKHEACKANAGELTFIERIEADAIASMLNECNGNKKLTARKLGIGRQTLYNKLAKFALQWQQ